MHLTIKLALGSVLGVLGCCHFLPCDPAWSYRPEGTAEVRDGGLSDVPGPPGTTVRVSAQLGVNNLMTRMEVTNLEDSLLSVEPAQVSVRDARGAAVSRMSPRTVPRCEGRPSEPKVRLARGEDCKIRVDWTVEPDLEALRRVRIEHRGLSRDAGPIPLSVTLDIVE